jgi:hypothetical protein
MPGDIPVVMAPVMDAVVRDVRDEPEHDDHGQHDPDDDESGMHLTLNGAAVPGDTPRSRES